MVIRKLFSVSEAAEILGLHQLTIRKYMKEGYLKGFKIGKCWKISEDELEKFIEGGY